MEGPVSEQALARTYRSPNYADSYETVEDYRRVMSYASRTDAGSTAIANRFDLPRGRVRPWIDQKSVPDPIRAINQARDSGWIDVGYSDTQFTALNTLVANIFSAGSILEANYVPLFALNHRGRDSHVLDALDLAGVEYQVFERDGRADEVRPTDNAPTLGRILSVLGAPVGAKAEQDLVLPTYLEDAPAETRELFVAAYLENRAIEHEGKDTLTVLEARNRDYLEDLTELIADVAGAPVDLGETTITISAAAARELGTVR